MNTGARRARRGHNKATIAVPNKLARIVWAVWSRDVDCTVMIPPHPGEILRELPEGGVTRQVSRDGGINPVWAKTGQKLFYGRTEMGETWTAPIPRLTETPSAGALHGR